MDFHYAAHAQSALLDWVLCVEVCFYNKVLCYGDSSSIQPTCSVLCWTGAHERQDRWLLMTALICALAEIQQIHKIRLCCRHRKTLFCKNKNKQKTPTPFYRAQSKLFLIALKQISREFMQDSCGLYPRQPRQPISVLTESSDTSTPIVFIYLYICGLPICGC